MPRDRCGGLHVLPQVQQEVITNQALHVLIVRSLKLGLDHTGILPAPLMLRPMSEHLTAEGLHLALETVRRNWAKQGAVFQGDTNVQATKITESFTFDEQPYRLTIHTDKTLQVMELDGDQSRPVQVPRGLPFPKGLVRNAR